MPKRIAQPIRFDSNPVVEEVESSTMTLAADVAIGSSGGPIMDSQGALLGVLTSGAGDFQVAGDCSVETIRPRPGVERGELTSRLEPALGSVSDADSTVVPADDCGPLDPPVNSGCMAARIRRGPGRAATWYALLLLSACLRRRPMVRRYLRRREAVRCGFAMPARRHAESKG